MTEDTKPDEPTLAQITAAMIAYDKALPAGCSRAPLALHVPALRAAILAALKAEEK